MLVELLDDVGVRQHVGGASRGINIGEWVEAVRPGSLHLCPTVHHLLMDGYCNGARVQCWVSSRSTDQVINQNVVVSRFKTVSALGKFIHLTKQLNRT